MYFSPFIIYQWYYTVHTVKTFFNTKIYTRDFSSEFFIVLFWFHSIPLSRYTIIIQTVPFWCLFPSFPITNNSQWKKKKQQPWTSSILHRTKCVCGTNSRSHPRSFLSFIPIQFSVTSYEFYLHFFPSTPSPSVSSHYHLWLGTAQWTHLCESLVRKALHSLSLHLALSGKSSLRTLGFLFLKYDQWD